MTPYDQAIAAALAVLDRLISEGTHEEGTKNLYNMDRGTLSALHRARVEIADLKEETVE